MHYDALRASVILSVSASVIAFASGHGLPVSTTYVAFAAVIATGLADRVMARGDAHLKIGRAIWVVTSWFLSALIAMAATAIIAIVVYHGRAVGIAAALALNLAVRYVAKRRSDAQEQRIHGRMGLRDIDDEGADEARPTVEPERESPQNRAEQTTAPPAASARDRAPAADPTLSAAARGGVPPSRVTSPANQRSAART